MSPAISAERPRGPIKSERNRAAAAGRSTFAGPASSTSSAFHKKRAQGRSNHGEASIRSNERNANGDRPIEKSIMGRHPRKNSGADAPAQVKDNKDDSDDNDDENEDDDDEDEDDDDDVRSKTALSLSGHQLPPLTALVDTLAQFSFLQRLDLSSIEPSDASPKGLDTLTWLAKAVFRSNASSKGKGRAFGDHLTWLNLSSNPNLTSESCIGLEALEELCVLTLSHCALTTVPPSITPLRNLKALVLNNNSISHLPDSFPHLPELNSLILSHNEITVLPASLPASLPALKKLSLGHNKLRGSESLPDFSLCLSLREVRLNDNPEIKSLPSHVRNWGKGADGKTAPGLELLELKDCGLDAWESLSTLGEAEDEKESQPRLRRKGLTQLLLKGNGVAMEEGFKEKILEVHPTLRVLDNERLQPRVRTEDREVDDSNANGKKKKTRTQSKPERRGRDVVEEHGADEESDDDEAAQMAAEMRALRRGKPEPKSSSKKGRKQESDNEDSDADDDEAAQMAADMRALRRGQATPRDSGAKKESSNSKSKSKQQSKALEASEDADRGRPKHKRGTRSGKKVNKTESTADKSTADRADRGFFEEVDAAEEKARLAPIYELSKKRAKIASGRTQVAEGVLEDATSSLSKARQKESKGRTELDTFDDTAPEPAKSAAPKAQAKKPKQKSDDTVEDRKVNTSVAGIVDLRKQAKSHRDADKGNKRKAIEKEMEGGGKKKARTSLPFIAAAKGVGEGGKTATSEAIGSGNDAWGAGGTSSPSRPIPTKAAKATTIVGLLLLSSSRNLGTSASISWHHKAAKAAVNNITSRNASYASDSVGEKGGNSSGGSGSSWGSSVDNPFKMDRPLNVFGRPLGQCGTNPMTGFYRDGYCNTGPADGGSHTVAAVVSQKWLDFSASKGNDLRPILSEGCSWCLCVSRWKQSFDAYKRGELPKEGVPKVKLEATHQRALDVVSLDDLKGFALDGGGRPASQDPSMGGPIR